MDRMAAMEAFVRVVDAGSFSGAAKQLRLGQIAVSKTIAQLEERLGVRLLLRSTHGLTLTEAGRNFYERAKRSIEEADEAEVGRAAPLPPPQIVSKMLQRGPHALIAEQGCSSFARCSGCWPHFLPADPGRIAPSIRPDLISGRDSPCCAGRPAGVCFFHAGGAVNRR
jgi:hypothetical protein